jgi:hypothetical protein
VKAFAAGLMAEDVKLFRSNAIRVGNLCSNLSHWIGDFPALLNSRVLL